MYGIWICKKYLQYETLLSFDRKVDFSGMPTFQLEMHKATNFQSNLLVPWELVSEGYHG